MGPHHTATKLKTGVQIQYTLPRHGVFFLNRVSTQCIFNNPHRDDLFHLLHCPASCMRGLSFLPFAIIHCFFFILSLVAEEMDPEVPRRTMDNITRQFFPQLLLSEVRMSV